jgi:hypothetical protein
MSRRPARFTQADIARAINAAKKADVQMAVEILPNGTIRLVPAPVGQMQDLGAQRRIVL